MNLTETTLDEVYVYKGRIINTRVDKILLPNGNKSDREVIEHSGGVCVGALTDNNELVFVRQFRYPYKQVILELPAGKLEKGEDPFECGKRELLEEAGVVANEYTFLGKLYPSPGYCAEIIWLYLARDLEFFNQQLDEDEFLEVEKIPLEKAVDMVLNNEIADAKTQTIVLKTKLLIDRNL